jgi:SpoVK/Ycf46/Vps4 family AAA+-type ATPase
MTAKVLAHELRTPLYSIQVDKLVTKFMGETAAKLRQIFDLIQRAQGVYLFDEFDDIGGERSMDNDVGEMRRVLNSFLQFIEADSSDSLIIATTNSPKLLDKALYRRFDDVLYYDLPDDPAKKRLMENVAGTFLSPQLEWKKITKEAAGLSHSEIDLACRDAIKQAILSDCDVVDASLLVQMLKERRASHQTVPEP